jgi:DNA-binding CsgD family transcriptional regulator
MHWTIAHREARIGLRLASALVGYLQLRSSFGEVRCWLEQILELEQTSELDLLRAKVAYGAGTLALKQNHLAQAQQHLKQSRDIALDLDNKRVLALSLGALSLLALEQSDYEQAYLLARDGLGTFEHSDDIWARGIVHSMCGISASRKCDFMYALVHYKLSLGLLRQCGDLHSEADVLVNVANMMRLRGKLITAHSLYQKAYVLYQQIDDRWGQVVCLHGIGDVLRLQGMFVEAQKSFTVCLQLATTLGSDGARATALWGLGQCALYQEDSAQAAHSFKACLHLSKELDYLIGVALSLQGLADLALTHGTIEEAQGYYEQSLQLARKLGDKVLMVSNLCGLGRVALSRNVYQHANTCFRQAMQLAREIGDMLGLATALGCFARLCGQISLLERSAQFLGSADALRQSLQAARAVIYHAEYERDEAMLKDGLGEEAFHENWMVGQTMTMNHTIGMIAQIHVPDARQHEAEKPGVSHYPAGLTTREVDVLRLVAEGLTDISIAKRLVLSPRTVNTHLRSIYAKIGVSSRSAATRYAVELKLV